LVERGKESQWLELVVENSANPAGVLSTTATATTDNNKATIDDDDDDDVEIA